MNRRYNYSRLTPPIVERFSCQHSQRVTPDSHSELGPGLSPGVPLDLYNQQPTINMETIHMPLYEPTDPTKNDNDNDKSLTADKLKPSKGCCGSGGL